MLRRCTDTATRICGVDFLHISPPKNKFLKLHYVRFRLHFRIVPLHAEMPSKIDILLQLASDSKHTDAILNHLSQNPELAATGDVNGYTLLHAASSYRIEPLMRALVQQYNVNPNITDGDGDTPLFFAETEQIARLLVEELGADVNWRNQEGITCREKVQGEVDTGDEDGAALLAYLESKTSSAATDSAPAQPVQTIEDAAEEVHPPPPLPDGISVNFGTMVEDETQAPDPEFRRMIEELASSERFHTSEGQAELKDIITQAVRGTATDQEGERASKRRA